MTLFDVPSYQAASRPVDALVRSTPNLRKGLSSIWMCGACGLMLVHHGHHSPPGKCPGCDHKKWWTQDTPTGPFFYDHDLVHALADLVGIDTAEIFETLIANRGDGS